MYVCLHFHKYQQSSLSQIQVTAILIKLKKFPIQIFVNTLKISVSSHKKVNLQTVLKEAISLHFQSKSQPSTRTMLQQTHPKVLILLQYYLPLLMKLPVYP